MTSAPNIEMIASSLRHCSLNGGFRRRVRHQDRDEGSDDSEGLTVELNSEVALPYRWQQCLDILTGQVYYVNWEDGTRTTVDPRTSLHFSTLSTPRSISAPRRATSTSSSGSSYTSVSSVGTVAAAEWFSGANGGYGYSDNDSYNDGDEEESSSSSSRSSAISSFSPTDESASSGSESGNTADHVLVAAGCRGCFMYFMMPKSARLCPKCGSSSLLHLGRTNNA
ncbi:unnamed protein product [Alopecurus aequalis]